MLRISFNVPFNFFLPVIYARLRNAGALGPVTLFMAVPKTAMNKNNGAVLGKNEIRLPGKSPVMEDISKSRPVQPAPYLKFWLGVL